MSSKQCPKCGVSIKHTANFHRHVKRCGTTAHRVSCPHCPVTFGRKDDLKKHLKKKHGAAAESKTLSCETCKKSFAYPMALNLHQEHCGKQKPKPFKCTFVGCGKCFSHKSTMEHHQQHAHLSQLGGGVKRPLEEDESEKELKKMKLADKVDGVLAADKEVSAMKGAKVDAFFKPKTKNQLVDQQVFFKETHPRLEAHLGKVLKEKKAVKWNLVYHCTLTMPNKYGDKPLKNNAYFRTPHPITSTYPQQLGEQLNEVMEVLEERMSTFMQAGSGWTLEENHALTLEMVDYQPIGGSSYIKLPVDIYDTKAVINIQNEDQECFKWSILAALHPALKNPQRVSKYQEFKDELNFEGINFPVTIDQISIAGGCIRRKDFFITFLYLISFLIELLN